MLHKGKLVVRLLLSEVGARELSILFGPGVLLIKDREPEDWKTRKCNVVELIKELLVQSLAREYAVEGKNVLNDDVEHILVEHV